jgi:alkaline phosphatase
MKMILSSACVLLVAACEPRGVQLDEACSPTAPCDTGLVCGAEMVCIAGPACGDGVVDGSHGEECDDGNAETEKSCADGRVECAVCDAGCRRVWLRSGPAKRVVLLIGDGMGSEQARAASLYAYGDDESLSFQGFPYRGMVTTDTADGATTDSAAAGTAMATGQRVSSRVVSVALPGDGSPLETILETAAARGLSTGLVTTTTVTDATPASFAAHVEDRGERASIATQMLTESQPTVLLGGASYVSPEAAEAAGYRVVEDRQELLAVTPDRDLRLSGQFGAGNFPYELDGLGDLPHLFEMTRVALEVLDQNERGFFLLVEGGRIDHACHGNDLERAVHETLAFAAAVEEARVWAQERPGTLLLVTADHETGGLAIERDRGMMQFPEVSWSTYGHTGTPVPVYGWGAGAELTTALVQNTDIYDLMMNALFASDGQIDRSPPQGGVFAPLVGGPDRSRPTRPAMPSTFWPAPAWALP